MIGPRTTRRDREPDREKRLDDHPARTAAHRALLPVRAIPSCLCRQGHGPWFARGKSNLKAGTGRPSDYFVQRSNAPGRRCFLDVSSLNLAALRAPPFFSSRLSPSTTWG